MRAVVVSQPGEVDALEVVDVPMPEPGPGEVLIEVAAAGLNRADLLQRRGFYDPPPGESKVLGLECSGSIAAVGEGVTDLPPGTQVCALLTGGGYAEYVVVPAGQVVAVPRGVTLVEAAGLMEVACTVWSNVFMMGKLGNGETLLVHGGGSGIGTMAIQLGKAFGARVVATVGSAEKAEFCRELGADIVINYKEQDFAEELKAQGVTADVILDIMGAKYLSSNISVLSTAGRLVIIGLQGGAQGRARHRCSADQAGRRDGDLAACSAVSREGGDRLRDGGAGVAADRRRHRTPDHPRDLPAGGRTHGAPGARGVVPHRQGPADAVSRVKS